MNQPTLFDGPTLALAGQRLAIEHADQVIENWSDRAYVLLIDFIKMYGSVPFKAEQFRNWVEEAEILPAPPSNRAYGSLFTKAKNEGVIRSAGIAKVSNPKAHSCFASLWIRS